MTAKIKLNAASGGGSFSLQAPSSSSNNRVITLPDIADGTLITNQTSGTVLQRVHTSGGSQTTIASTTFTDTGGTATITPTSSSSKILVFISITLQLSRSNTSATGGLKIVRLISGGSDVSLYEIPINGLGPVIAAYGNTVTFRGQICANVEDSPNTTTSTTYRVQIAAGTTSDSGQAIANNNNVPCQITLLEVAP
jgi:hypothetical protein